jgi:uncharacterized protein YjiS (DUF1127 family)
MHQSHGFVEKTPSAQCLRPALSSACKQQETTMDIRKTFKKWAAYQQTVRELAALDNRQLNDLGISRTDISRVARDHASSL